MNIKPQTLPNSAVMGNLVLLEKFLNVPPVIFQQASL